MKVSVICPCNRPEDIPHVTEMFNRQNYPNKELILVTDDGTIGHKRNVACESATGDVIVHFDSDDYYAPDYISYSVQFLLNNNADVTGLRSGYFFNPNKKKAWLYEYKLSQPFVLGSGMIYHKNVWMNNKFRDTSFGEDNFFLANAGIIKPHRYISGFCAKIHDNNTCSHLAVHAMNPIKYDTLLNSLSFEI